MDAPERLQRAIEDYQGHLRALVPPNREAAILALLCLRDRLSGPLVVAPPPDLVTGDRLADPGGNKALQLILEATPGETVAGPAPFDAGLDGWAARFLEQCASLAEAELVLAEVGSGFMRLVDDGRDTFDAWIATKRPPAAWRERADIDWWAGSLVRRHAPELHGAWVSVHRGGADDEASYRRVADAYLATFAWQVPYPPSAVIGGHTVQVYQDVLAWLITSALRARDRNDTRVPQCEGDVVAAIASDLDLDPTVAGAAVSAFTLDREGAAWHAAVPGIAAAPLVRVGPDRVVLSVYGLTTDPLLFLFRELRRRDAPAYHNIAHHREAVFRQDLYALFDDKRFVTSKGRIELRREGGTIRTDIDAAVVDRKTGTLALFELKSQDPFARSAAERARQRDNVLFANRQVSGVLDWVKRHGANELLGRIDSRTARTNRVHKVYPFVLGRYLVHFSDGPGPDRRAAWGTWPQLLRLLESQPVRATVANPIASLHARLAKDDPIMPRLADLPSHEITIGSARLTVHSSWPAYQASGNGRG